MKKENENALKATKRRTEIPMEKKLNLNYLHRIDSEEEDEGEREKEDDEYTAAIKLLWFILFFLLFVAYAKQRFMYFVAVRWQQTI